LPSRTLKDIERVVRNPGSIDTGDTMYDVVTGFGCEADPTIPSETSITLDRFPVHG
jgi:hypothetical protein